METVELSDNGVVRQEGCGAENSRLSWLDRKDVGRKQWIVVARQEGRGHKTMVCRG